MLVVISLIGTMSAIGISNITALNNPLQNGTNELTGFLKQARARAISTTSAYTVRPLNETQIITEVGNSCDDPAPELDATLTYTFPHQVHIPDTSWEICFTSRGLATSSPTIYVYGPNNKVQSISIYLGGAVHSS